VFLRLEFRLHRILLRYRLGIGIRRLETLTDQEFRRGQSPEERFLIPLIDLFEAVTNVPAMKVLAVSR
jgi:hypothetical protein